MVELGSEAVHGLQDDKAMTHRNIHNVLAMGFFSSLMNTKDLPTIERPGNSDVGTATERGNDDVSVVSQGKSEPPEAAADGASKSSGPNGKCR
jgi:hypothetical protein